MVISKREFVRFALVYATLLVSVIIHFIHQAGV